MPGGQPTKYKPEYCDAIIEFFSVDPWLYVDIEYTNKKGDTWTKQERRANSLPKFHDFARSIGVNEDTVVEWTHAKDAEGKPKHPEFSAAYKRAKELQKWFLIENALNNLYNSTAFIFTAKNVTDMRDRQEVTGPDGQPFMPAAQIASKTADELLRLLTAASTDSARSRKRPPQAGRST